MRIKKGLKTGRKLLLAICLPVLAVAIVAAAVIGAVLGTDGNGKRSPFDNLAESTVAGSSTTINLGNTKINSSSTSAVQSLINHVAGSTSNVTYSTLSTNMESWKGTGSLASSTTKTKVASQLSGKTVTLGGIVWNIMYVSKADYTANGTTAGDIIVTLWQAASDATYMSAYSGSPASNTPDDKYPSAMYGASLVRSTLVGSNYSVTRKEATLPSNGSQNSHWAPFTSGIYAEVLATPANMKWQETQKMSTYIKNASTGADYPWWFPNDAWGNIGTTNGSTQISGGCWYNNTNTGIYNYSDNEYGSYNANSAYVAWKNDKIWLPSATEVGFNTSYKNTYGTTGAGLWDATTAQRQTGVTSGNAQYSWLRSGYNDFAYYAYIMNSAGAITNGSTTYSCAVRPALHLNLKSAAQAAGLLTQNITYHAEYGTAPANGTYTPGATTALSAPKDIPTGLTFNGWVKDSYTGTTKVTSLSGQTGALNLYATYTLAAPTVTATPSNKSLSITYGANATMSASLTHAFVTSGKATSSVYWRYNSETTNLSTSTSYTLTKPAVAKSGTYTMYYTITPTTAEKNKGLLAYSGNVPFTLTVGKASLTATAPTISNKVYVGQAISAATLTGGSAKNSNNETVAGTWAITTTGNFKSTSAIKATFTPTDSANYNTLTNIAITNTAEQLYLKLSDSVTGIDGATAASAQNIAVDYNTTPTFTIDKTNKKVNFSVAQDGTVKSVGYTISAPAGYTPYLHESGSSTKLTSLGTITANKNLVVSYTADTVKYLVYYILSDETTGTYPTFAATTETELDKLAGNGRVYKYTGSATTGSAIKYLDTNNKPLNTDLANKSDFSRRTLDTAKTGTIGKVKGDGTSIALVYYRMLDRNITYHSAYGTAPVDPDGKYIPGTDVNLMSVTGIPSGLTFRGWAKGSYSGELITSLSGQNQDLDLYATFTLNEATITTTPTSRETTITYGAGAAMSAEITHAFVSSGDATVSTRWCKDNNDIATGNGITVVNGEHPSLTFAKPTRSQAGTYVLKYTLTTTASAKANKGLFDRTEGEAARYTLTVNKANLSVAQLPTITPPAGSTKLYIGQSISATQLSGGVVHCTSANDNNVAGTWAITTTGVYTSYGKITAKFTPTDTDNLNTLTGVEITTNAQQLYLKVIEDVSGLTDLSGVTAKPAADIAVDYGSSIGFSVSDEKFTFMVKQNGVENTVDYAINAHTGYTSYLHLTADAEKEEITATSAVLTNVTETKLFTVAYMGADTAYTVYYLLDSPDSDFPEATTSSALDALISGGSQLVYKSDLMGATGSRVKYLSNGLPLNAQLAARADISQRVLDEQKTGEIKVVSSDGSTVQLIYLKLKTYTMTYAASGASPSLQTKVCKYGTVIGSIDIVVPAKDMSDFKGWFYDAEFETALDEADKVVADTQLYAKFDTKHYTLVFDFNVGTGANQLPNDYRTVSVDSAKLLGGKVAWETGSLFAESFGFKVSTGTGRYEIDYTVNNLTANKSITGIKPSAIGYTFGGWYENANCTGAQTTVIRRPNASTDDTIVLYAKWTPATYTMRFDKQDGSRISTKTVRNMSAWGQDDTDLLPGATGAILPANPSRSGYIFQGWYIDNDENSNSVYSASNYKDENGNWVFSISDFADSGLYGSAATGFNFSSLTVYAIWKSVDIQLEAICEHGGASFYRDGIELSSTDPVYINDTITVEIDVDNGYEFKNLIVGGRALSNGITTFTIAEKNIMNGVDDYGDEYNYITVEVVFVEERFTIQYDTDGGKAADSTFARTYTASNIGADSQNRAKLPSLLTKRGFDFAGWIFKTTADDPTPDTAFETDGNVDNLYGADLWLKKPYDDVYRDVTLKAVWTPQKAEVYLYNATYSGVYNKDANDSSRYVISDFEGDDIVTEMTIDIINPSRGESFVFLGWATTRNGAVVYPVDDRYDFISYKVFAHKDEKGNLLNLNNLYAVWHVAGIDYVIMSADKNNCTYGGSGITMSAKPSRNYESDTSATIVLNYKWYKIYEGRYDECFIVKDYEDKEGYKWYIDESGNITAYSKDGKYYAEDKTTEITQAQAEERGTKLTYKEFNPLSVNEACVLKAEQPNKKPEDAISYNVRNVNDCGIYVCVVEVVATEQGSGSTTRSSAYGEVEIAMNKAVYSGLSMAKKKVTYNSTPRGDEITVTGLPVTVENGFRTITLPDGSKVNVTYTYFALGEDGVTRTEITDVNDIKNVGKYVVVANFAFAVGGDKGNYEELKELEAELTISADTLSVLEFGFMHGGERNTSSFSGVYDGTPYSVDVAIKDTLKINSGSVLVTDADDVCVVVKVYKITENGDEEVTGDTVDAGTYAVVIVGLDGEAADNYIIAGGLTMRKEYTINKRVYDVAGHISFNDEEVVFDHELHTLSIKVDADKEMPSTVSVTYSVDYTAEEADFTEGRLSNETVDKNGGRYAGTYVVTVTFTDSASDNYEELEGMTATLTIKKAKFFEFYNKDGADLLRDGGFVNGSYAYSVGAKYNPHISGTILSDSEHFSITYEYYRVSETQRDRTMLGSGTYEQLVAAGNLISLAGKYEIVALIKYESALYRNNFEEIDESESTITYLIRNVNVESVEVVAWADGFNMEAKLGSAFDYSWIKQINVTYAENAGTLEVTSEADIALAGITLEKKDGADQTTFWHTGAFNIKVSFYGTESEAYEFTVKEEVQNMVLKYGTGAGYSAVPEDGLVLLTDGTSYSFIIEYRCTDESGVAVTRTSEVNVAAGGLVLGTNVLTVTEDYYTFAEELTVDIYKVIANVIWEYSLDGTTWNIIPDSHELVYAGKEYMIRVRFEDGGTQYCEAYTDSGFAVLNVNANGYLMQVGRSGNYKVTSEYSLAVTPKVLEFTWDTSALEYNTWHRSPKVATSGLEEADRELITFGYEFYSDGVLTTTDKVVNVGEYEVSVVLLGDATARNNYTLEGSATAMHKFEIVKADIVMSAVYSESNYGENRTYAGNPQGLRIGAMKKYFGDNAEVEGDFSFITDYDEETGEYNVVEDEKQLASLIVNQGYVTVWYVYVPENKNYNDYIGSITINVLQQSAKSGAGALFIELGPDAVPFYLVNQEFDTHGIEVYKLYDSAYQERGKWYGLKTKVEKPSFRIGSNMMAQGYKITALDLSNEKVVLKALSGSDSGTLDIPVVEKTPTKLEVSSTNHRTEFYVGETPDFADIEFRALFGVGENPQEGLKVGAVKTTFDETITQEGTFTVVFTYFKVSCKVTFTAKAKDELQIVNPVNTVLTYKGGEVLDVPEIGFMVDGVKCGQNELEGVKVNVAVYKNGKLASLAEEGEYVVRYSFEITNPRFSKHAYVEVAVTVTKNPYKVDITVPDGESVAYTGEPVNIPKPTVGAVTDSTDGDAELPANRVSTLYTVNGKEVDINKASDWLMVNRGTYKVVITVKVLQSGEEPYTVKTVEYTFTITQAENDAGKASVDAKNVVLGEGANFDFKVTADFGANTAVLEYGMSRDGVYTTDKPTEAGTYYVRAKIAETNNYKGLTTMAVPFEVRNPGIEAGENGSVSGGNGTGADWSLEINEMDADDVSKESISKQNVLTGYEVVLKNSNGVAVSGEGEYTVRVKLSEELSGKTDLKIFYKTADGKTVEKAAKIKDGYIEFKTSEFGTFIITTKVPGEPVGLLVAVIVLGVVAAAGIAACIIVFVKKKKKGAEQ